jgi:Ca2+-binding RTX toxin-like protein
MAPQGIDRHVLRLFGKLGVGKVGVDKVAIVALVASALAIAVAGPTVAEPLGADSVVTADTLGDTGKSSAIAIDSEGNPVIAYRSTAGTELRVLHCTNPDCSGSQTPQAPDSSDDVGDYAAIVLDAQGNPVISYYDDTNGDLKVLHCTNPDCSGTQAPQSPDTAGYVGLETSIALDAAGNPVIADYASTGQDLRILHCTNPDCSGVQTSQSPDTVGNVGWEASLVLDAVENPVVAYYRAASGDLRLLHCTNADYSGSQTPQTPNSAGFTGTAPSLVLDGAGNPVIAYHSLSDADLKLVHCTTIDCSGTQTPRTADTNGSAGETVGLALSAEGNPVLVYNEGGGDDLWVMHCTSADCSGVQTPVSVDTAGSVGAWVSMELGSYGNPVAYYRDTTNASLKVLHCWDAAGCGSNDQDMDGVSHAADNCPLVENPDQVDLDEDTQGDACDPDDDNDTVDDVIDNCRTVPNPDQVHLDQDDIGDLCDDVIATIPAACAEFVDGNLIVGTDGDDVIEGTAGPDVIVGLDGDDTINANGGADVICAGDGDDVVNGNSGADIIRGQAGVDVLFGGGGNDTIKGGGGDDTIKGNNGKDMLWGGSGRDTISGGAKADTIYGNSSADDLSGNKGADTIHGGTGADAMRGGSGRDTLPGGLVDRAGVVVGGCLVEEPCGDQNGDGEADGGVAVFGAAVCGAAELSVVGQPGVCGFNNPAFTEPGEGDGSLVGLASGDHVEVRDAVGRDDGGG